MSRPRNLIGAIRWDAWSGGATTRIVERTLGPRKYHSRLPWYARIVGEDAVSIDGGRREIVEAEIGYAADAGIDYWAFVLYPRDLDLSVPLDLYLASPVRDRLKFSVILTGHIVGPDANWGREFPRLTELMASSAFQRVQGDRPLVYMYWPEMTGDGDPGRFAELRAAAVKAGLGNPYLVYQGWMPEEDWAKARALGFDAIAGYANGGSGGGTYADLIETVERGQWGFCAANNVPLIPLVQTGWDKRPRMDHPVPWETGEDYLIARRHFEAPTTGEIAAHLGRGLDWVDAHPDLCPARAVLVYAWNENDEGGWLVPTRGPDGGPNTDRLRAVRALLDARRRDGRVP